MIIFPNLFLEVQASLEELVRFDFDRRKKSGRGSHLLIVLCVEGERLLKIMSFMWRPRIAGIQNNGFGIRFL